MRNRDPFDLLGMPPAEARLIRYFLIRPNARPHLRELQRTLRLGGASIQRAVERLTRLGALAKTEEGGRILYAVVSGAAAWRALRLLEGVTEDPAPLVREALVDVRGIEVAFIFGSVATGEAREGSDVDVLILERPDLDRKRLYRQLSEVSVLLGREVNAVRYTAEALADRLGDRTHPAWGFVRDVLSSPKEWIIGAATSLTPIAMAAGISREALQGTAA